MKTHNYRKRGRKHKHAKSALMQEVNGEHYRQLDKRKGAQGFINGVLIVFVSLVLISLVTPPSKANMLNPTNLLSPLNPASPLWVGRNQSHGAEAPPKVTAYQPTDDCGRVVGTSATPSGEYRSPEDCQRIRAETQRLLEQRKGDGKEFVIAFAIAAVILCVFFAIAL